MPVSAFDLTGRAALVTGSTYGLGRGIARALAAAGCDVVLNGRSCAKLAGLDAELTAFGSRTAFIEADMSRLEDNQRLVDEAFTAFGACDILVTNAGGFFDAPFLEMTPERFARTFDLNVRGQYFTIQAFVKRCLARDERGGRIILMASANGLQSESDSTAYDASKGAVCALTRALAVDLGPLGFTVNALCPGLIVTPLTEGHLQPGSPVRRHYEAAAPLRRLGVEEDVGPAAVYLASDAGRYVTGQMIVIDGGLTAQQVPPVAGGEGCER